jgi:hypothetical protein
MRPIFGRDPGNQLGCYCMCDDLIRGSVGLRYPIDLRLGSEENQITTLNDGGACFPKTTLRYMIYPQSWLGVTARREGQHQANITRQSLFSEAGTCFVGDPVVD